MELVYLWVEEYKNIKNQGFNFSPRFTCKYDKNKNELSIEEKKDYVSIFPENINVTAIVGENGSGKSSIIKIILMLIYGKQSLEPQIESQLKEYKFFLIIKKNDRFEKISLIEDYESITDQDNTQIEEIQTIDFFSIHFNYMLDTLYDGTKDEWIKKIYHRNDRYATPILLEPYKNADNEEKIDLKIIEYLNNQRILKFYNNIKTDTLINSFFNPNKLKIFYPTIKEYGLKKTLKENSQTQFNYDYEIQDLDKLSYKIQKMYSKKITRERMGTILDSINDLYVNKNANDINIIYLALKLMTPSYSYNKEVVQKIEKLLTDTKNIKAKDVINKIIKEVNQSIDKILAPNDTSYENEKIRRCLKFHQNYQNQQFRDIFTNSIDDIKIISELNNNFHELVPPWIEVEFFDNSKSIKSLSSGQKGLFTFIINILYQLSNLKQKQQYQSLNLFLDETDVGFHPAWQTSYLNETIKSIEKIWDKKINIVFLTHSPFILSDIPKKNVIFLENDENHNCINMTNYITINTFGANIHTLLSHGFFMKEGLMGEFAKERINQAIKYLNQKELTKDEIDYCENIISIIGEPILKSTLQAMLSSKETKLDKLKRQKEELEKAIKREEEKVKSNETN